MEVWFRRVAWARLPRSGPPKDPHTHRENHWDLRSHRENLQVHRSLREEVYQDFLPPRRPHPLEWDGPFAEVWAQRAQWREQAPVRTGHPQPKRSGEEAETPQNPLFGQLAHHH